MALMLFGVGTIGVRMHARGRQRQGVGSLQVVGLPNTTMLKTAVATAIQLYMFSVIILSILFCLFHLTSFTRTAPYASLPEITAERRRRTPF